MPWPSALVLKNSKGEWLEVFYQQPLLNPAAELVAAAKETLGYEGGNQAIEADGGELSAFADAIEADDNAQATLARACTESQKPVVVTILETDEQSSTTPEVYLKTASVYRIVWLSHTALICRVCSVCCQTLPGPTWAQSIWQNCQKRN